jgi:hypothetical protein
MYGVAPIVKISHITTPKAHTSLFSVITCDRAASMAIHRHIDS